MSQTKFNTFASKITVLGVLALLAGMFSPIFATAAVGAEFSASPASGSTLNLDDSATLSTTFGLPTNSTLNATMQQTWRSGQALVGDITSPTGWDLQYQVDGAWQNSAPTDRSTISGVRANVTNLATGPGTENGNQAVATATSSLITADADTIAATGRGDGWDVFLSPKYILNVYHHDTGAYKLECHLRTTGEICGDLYHAWGYFTGAGSSGTYYKNKVYSVVAHDGDIYMLCTNVGSFPFSSCGSTFLDSGVVWSDWYDAVGTQDFDGTRIWSVNPYSGNLLCFNVTTATKCTGLTLPNYQSSTVQEQAWSNIIGDRLYVTTQSLYCYVPSTLQVCSGTWPILLPDDPAASLPAYQINVIPKRTTNGIVNGVCTVIGIKKCWDLTGTEVSYPAGLQDMLENTDQMNPGFWDWNQAGAWNSTKYFYPIYSESAGGLVPACYDWTTDSKCEGFAQTTFLADGEDGRYAFVVSPYNENCVWTNGDSGIIVNFDANTGLLGCPVTTTKAEAVYDALPRYSCSELTGYVRTFDSLQITMPVGSTFDRANLRVSVYNSNGNAVVGYQDLAPVGGIVDLSGLNVADTSSQFRFVIESVNNITHPLSSEDANGMATQLVYESDPVQLCVSLSAIMPVCPAVLTSGSIPQPDLVTTSFTTYTIAGHSAVNNSKTATYHINTIQTEQCYVWKSFFNSSGFGINTSNAQDFTHVSSIVFGPDKKMYVGGNFTDAGGHAGLSYLAAWDGAEWTQVGPTAGVFDARINSLAFSKDGKLLVGGDFQNAAGLPNADFIAIYDPKTQTWSAPSTELNSIVQSIVVSGSTAYLGGWFNGAFASLNIDSLTWNSVSTPDNGIENLTVAANGNVYAAGFFSGYVKRYDPASNTWSDISSAANTSDYISNSASKIAVTASKVYVVGWFNGVAVLDLATDTWSWLSGSRALDGYAHALTVDKDGKVYVGGVFDNAGDVSAIDMAMWDGTSWHGFRDSRTRSKNMTNVDWGEGGYGASWTVTMSPNNVAVWGGYQTNCADRSELDYLCYFGDKITLASSTPSSGVSDGPYVTSQSTRTEVTTGGTQLIIKGHLLGKTTSVTIGGVACAIVSVTNDQVICTMPPHEPGDYKLLLSFSDKTFTYDSWMIYKASVKGIGSRPPVKATISGFADGRSVLTKKMKARIAAFIRKYADYKTIQCIGYTEGPTVLKSDKALSKSRAKVTCNWALAGIGKGMTLKGTSAGQDTKVANALRRVVIILRDN